MKKIKIKNTEPKRLDSVLAEVLKVSRSNVQKAIKKGLVLVNDKKVINNTLITNQDLVTYDPVLTHPVKPKIIEKNIDLEVIYEDDDVIVVNKPAGLLVHPTDTSAETTLFDLLKKRIKKFEKIGESSLRGGIVHRLDKMVSGILIVAKNQKAFEHLKEQFKERHAQKMYTTLVHGTMDKKHGKIDLSIERSKSTGRMAAKPASQGGRVSLTNYSVLTQYPHHALLDVKIETGRTHQIRTHLFAIGHPVVGDPLYKQRNQKLMNIGRIFLHSRELTITLPSGEKMTFEATLPKELEKVLEKIPKL